MNGQQLLAELMKGLNAFTLGNAVMIAAGIVLVYLAVSKEYEPVLLLPIGFGCAADLAQPARCSERELQGRQRSHRARRQLARVRSRFASLALY